MAKEIRVPTLGESVTEATIGQWFKKQGDAVADGETLLELETDKVTLEVPAPAAGTLGEIIDKHPLSLKLYGKHGRTRAPPFPKRAPSFSKRAPQLSEHTRLV